MGMVFVGVSVFVFFAILAGILFHRIIGWFIEGSITAVQCVALAGVYLVVIGTIIVTPSPVLQVTLAVLLIVVVVTLPFIGEAMVKRDTKDFYDDKMDGYRDAIARDPRNLAARARLADAMYKQGRLDEAIEELTALVQIAPGSQDDSRRLQRLIEEREERRSPPVNCPHCGQPNDSTRTRCAYCESDLNAVAEVKKWLVEGGLRKIVISSAIGIGILALLFFAVSFLSVIGRITFVALILLVVIGGGFIYIQRRY